MAFAPYWSLSGSKESDAIRASSVYSSVYPCPLESFASGFRSRGLVDT
jgi:hypothetical protein